MQQRRWRSWLIEGSVIVLSILLAFGIEAWWARRQETLTVRDALAGVADELRAARAELATDGLVHQRLAANTVVLVALMDSSALGDVIAAPDTLVAGLFDQYVSDPPTAVVRAFVSAGLADATSLDPIRRSLFEWMALIQDQRDDQLLARQYGSVELQPFLRSEFDVTGAQRMLRLMTRGSFDAGSLEARGTTELRVTSRSRNLVAWQLDHLDRISRQNATIQGHADTLADLIGVALDSS
jgi:hypothetical protein